MTVLSTDKELHSLALRHEMLAVAGDEPFPGITLRDVAAVLFRQRRIALCSFAVLLIVTSLLSGILTSTYRAELRILVRRGRVDPVVNPEPGSSQQVQEQITESELNSEVELISSQDLIRKVVVANGLDKQMKSWRTVLGGEGKEVKIAKAARMVGQHLAVEPLHKTNMIAITFESPDPNQAAGVLSTLGALYLEKHLQVHRPSGEYRFFDQETEQLRQTLQAAEGKLVQFTEEHNIVSADYERDLTLQKASELEGALALDRASIAETERRIANLERQAASIPPRMTTQLRTADNPQLLEQMKSTLLGLELKRSELLSKFEPTYPPVVEIEKQIADTRTTIETEQKAPLRDETTDQNPVYVWVKEELAKAETELNGQKARTEANARALAAYYGRAKELQQAAVIQGDLRRSVKTQEENYLLYLHKQEEARINDALDEHGILNVAIAEPVTVPTLPTRAPVYYGMLCVLLSLAGSIAVAFGIDALDPSFRTPTEVQTFLGVPVLASLPIGRNDVH